MDRDAWYEVFDTPIEFAYFPVHLIKPAGTNGSVKDEELSENHIEMCPDLLCFSYTVVLRYRGSSPDHRRRLRAGGTDARLERRQTCLQHAGES